LCFSHGEGIEGCNGSVNALEHELARRLKIGPCLDRGTHFGVDENLAGARLRT
jgi:hypothetical protein